jgi:ubiquinone/menaquinone biosynthesis C-methylase UbiE
MRSQHCATGFADVDASGEAARLAAYLRAASAADVLRDGKHDAVAALGLRPGDRALDVGCGLGDEVCAMAALVAPGGRAVGLDTSRAFLETARAQAATAGVEAEFVAGDAHRLPFPDGSFDAVRCERTLQHLTDPAAAVREMARVTATGGVVTLSEPDWETLVFDLEPAALSAQVRDTFLAHFKQPAVGRTLVRLLADAGMAEIRSEPGVVQFRDAATARELLDLERIVPAAAANGDGEAWLAELDRRGAEGSLFIAATGFFVIARKP